MTEEQIRVMPAGRELDRAVAQGVFGLPERTLDDPCPNCGGEMRNCGIRARCFNCDEWIHAPYRDYSTDIAAAWDVVEKMHARGWLFHVLAMVDGWVVNAREYALPPDGDWQKAMNTPGFVQEPGDTAPETICRAALSAVTQAGHRPNPQDVVEPD